MKGKAKKERNCGACGGAGHRKDSRECPEYGKGGAQKSAQGGGKGMPAPTSLRTLVEQIVDERLEKRIRELFA